MFQVASGGQIFGIAGCGPVVREAKEDCTEQDQDDIAHH